MEAGLPDTPKAIRSRRPRYMADNRVPALKASFDYDWDTRVCGWNGLGHSENAQALKYATCHLQWRDASHFLRLDVWVLVWVLPWDQHYQRVRRQLIMFRWRYYVVIVFRTRIVDDKITCPVNPLLHGFCFLSIFRYTQDKIHLYFKIEILPNVTPEPCYEVKFYSSRRCDDNFCYSLQNV